MSIRMVYVPTIFQQLTKRGASRGLFRRMGIGTLSAGYPKQQQQQRRKQQANPSSAGQASEHEVPLVGNRKDGQGGQIFKKKLNGDATAV